MKRIAIVFLTLALLISVPGVITVDAVAVASSGDFELKISVEQTTLPQGEDFRVDVELKNKSGEYREITYSILVWPEISGWDFYKEQFGDGIAVFDLPEPVSTTLAPGEILRNLYIFGPVSTDTKFPLGHTLEPGTHELRFRATFGINEGDVLIWSNPIMLTVTDGSSLDVPRTGVPNMTGTIMATFALLTVSVALAAWGYSLRRKSKVGQ